MGACELTLVEKIKSQIRLSVFYNPILQRKARKQDEKYLALREKYYLQEMNFSPNADVLERSRSMLGQRFARSAPPKSSPSEVRLFVVDIPGLGGPWFESELARNFDAACFGISRHKRGFRLGEKDLVSFGSGIDLEDRRDPGFYAYEDEGLKNRWSSRFQQDLVEALSKAHGENPIDLALVYGGYGLIRIETFQKIRNMGIPVAIMSLDDRHAFLAERRGGAYGEGGLSSFYDVQLTNSPECMAWYLSEGVPAYYFPQGIDPELYFPTDSHRDIDVSFVGMAYGHRMRFIRSLRRNGIAVECFGKGWENGAVDDAIHIYRRSKINIGIGDTGFSGKVTCIKGRDFEIPATGSLYLTTYDPDLARLFHVGREILCYRNEVDCSGQIQYYLSHPEEARAIAAAGRKRCIAEHSWTRRMIQLLEWMGILRTS